MSIQTCQNEEATFLMANDSKIIFPAWKNIQLSLWQLKTQSVNPSASFTFGTMVSLEISLKGDYALKYYRAFLQFFC